MKKESILIIVIIILAVISRLSFLDLRVLHHDEGVNYFFSQKIIAGEGYRYDSTNYHGPLYFFLIALSFLFFGISEFSLRLPAALFGIALVLIPFLWKRNAIRNEFNKYVASFLLLISPSLLYYSRYSIHEIAFVLFSLIAVYSFTLILENSNLKYLPLFAVSLALLFTIKETAIIMLFILFVMILINFKRIKRIDFKEDYHLISFSILLFAVVYVLLFTSFFTNPYGIVDSVRGFLPWTGRGIEGAGHDKPFYYYVLILLRYEWPIFILSLFGAYHSYKLRSNVFLLNLSMLFVLSLVIYSLIPYKTPWLIINITAPMCLLAAIGLKNIKIDELKKNFKILFFVLILAGLVYLAYFSVNLNFVKPWQQENKFAYVHTDKDILNMVEKINEQEDKSAIFIVSDEYWPLPFYLDSKNVSYSTDYSIIEDDFKVYNIFIVRDKYFNATEFPSEYEFETYKLREGINLFLVYHN